MMYALTARTFFEDVMLSEGFPHEKKDCWPR